MNEDRYCHFDTQGLFWTPEWCPVHNQAMTVRAVKLPDGTWHEFRGHLVSIGEANEVYQAAVRKGLGLR